MLDEFGVPSDAEGLLGIQVFKALRGFRVPSVFEIPSEELDGVRLRLGELPDEYFKLRALAAAQAENALSGLKPERFRERFAAVFGEARAESGFGSRPITALVGWRATSIRRREPLAGWDWVDLGGEHDRGIELREEVHAALDRSAAGLSLGLSEFLEDRLATHSFWIAPGLEPVVVLRGLVGTAEVYAWNDGEPPRTGIEGWIEQVSRVPPTVDDAISEPLALLATARALEPSWRRFTLGWAVLDRLAGKVGARFDDQIVVEQRKCPSCGADVTPRKPGARRRVEELLQVFGRAELVPELNRINELRGRSHGGDIPDDDLLAPERLGSAILEGIVSNPERIPDA
jgi:hypothetical protein